MANFQSEDEYSSLQNSFSEQISDHINDQNGDNEELVVSDDGSEGEPPGMEVLEAPMFNLLLNIYNQESGHEFKAMLYEMLPLMVQLGRHDAIDSLSLIKLMANSIYQVAEEIKSKLVIRAIERHDLLAPQYKITSAPTGPDELPQPDEPKLSGAEMAWDVGGWAACCEPDQSSDGKLYVRGYRECPHEFNSLINSIWRYFDFLDSKSAFIEDLYLNFIEFLDLDVYNDLTWVVSMHHEAFRNTILRDVLLRQVISQAEAHRDSALNPPVKYLDLIYGIRRRLPYTKESYEAFFATHKRSLILHKLFFPSPS